jgi:hypothetical protein
MSDDQFPSYKPSAFYFRRALRNAPDKRSAIIVGLAVTDEYERLRAWVREQGLLPPKWRVLKEELRDKGWDCPESNNVSQSSAGDSSLEL